MGLGGLVLGSLILYLKGMRRMMFQLSGFYYKPHRAEDQCRADGTGVGRQIRKPVFQRLDVECLWVFRIPKLRIPFFLGFVGRHRFSQGGFENNQTVP